MKKIITGGTIVTATDTYKADVLIEDGIIQQIALSIQDEEAEVIDASGKLLFLVELILILI